MKHNKKRNTAFIYELLTRELTKALVDKNLSRSNKVVAILKEFFTPGLALSNELQLYNVLLETYNIHPKVAERLLTETKKAHARLDENTIFDAQSRIIAAINKGLGKEGWANFVPNFKALASVNTIFSSRTTVKKKVLFEQLIVDKMSEKQENRLSPQMQPIDNLAYISFIKKFNNKYNDILKEQKEFLNKYITSFADDGFELRLYLNEEISRLKGLLSKAEEAEFEPLLLQKVGEVREYLEGFRKREFIEDDFVKVLKTQQLVQELVANDHN